MQVFPPVRTPLHFELHSPARRLAVGLCVLASLLFIIPFNALAHPTPSANALQQQAHSYEDLCLNLAIERFSLGDASSAIALLKPLIDKPTPSLEALYLLVGFYKEARRPYELLPLYDALLKQQPTVANLWFEKALVYASLGQRPLAIEALQQATQLAPTDAKLFFELGILQSEVGQHVEASQASLKAIQLNYKLAESYNNRAYALIFTGDLAQAEADLQQALTLYKAEGGIPPATLDTLGYLRLKQGKYHEALQQFDAALKLNTHLSEVYLHKADALEALGLYRDALEQLRLYLRLSPADEQTRPVVERFKQLQARLKGANGVNGVASPMDRPFATPLSSEHGEPVGGAAPLSLEELLPTLEQP
ncbi:MAG: tetratricopeptide repeat protein [Vampirovibrionales bacterium]